MRSSQMEGQNSFLFTMAELTDLYGNKPIGQEVHVNVSVYDWFLQQNRTGSAITVISSNDVTMKLLGDYSRSFRPGFPISIYVSRRMRLVTNYNVSLFIQLIHPFIKICNKIN